MKKAIIYILICAITCSCSAAKIQRFKELNRPAKSIHYRDTVINNQFVRIYTPKKKTPKQKKVAAYAGLISVGVFLVWLGLFERYGD
jgi:hypothetical protein